MSETVTYPNTNGLHVAYSDDGSTIWIALPRELWRPINGGCCCRYCSEDLTAKPAFWDTLAVAAAKRKPGQPNTTWGVHRPEQHGAEPKRSTE